MNLKQQVESVINVMSEEKLQQLIRFANFLNKSNYIEIKEPDPSSFNAILGEPEKKEKKGHIRFGLGKGVITNVEDFSSFDDEIAELFEDTF